jgi:hypothetical protein
MAEGLPREGLVAVVKRDCPTCEAAAPMLGELAPHAGLTTYIQENPSSAETVAARINDNRALHIASARD